MSVDGERATQYDGPVRVSPFSFGGREVRLVQPAEPDRLLDDPSVLAWNQRDDYMPYWAYLWPGALLLAEVVARESWRAGLTALEIGCGLGLAGMVALSRGLKVHFTDYDEAPLQFVARSAAANGFDPSTYSTQRLDWRDLPGERFPVILGTDVLYEKRLVPLVANLLATMLEPEGIALIAGPYRVASQGFETELATLGLDCDVQNLSLADSETGPVRGMVHRVWRRVVSRQFSVMP